MVNNVQLFKGDCLEIMDELIERGVKVDCIITDLPYQTTSLKWDVIIPFDLMWKRINKLIKKDRNILLFAQEPFTSALIQSNLKQFKYKTICQKTKPTGFPMANYRPLKSFEELILFTDNPCTYTKSKREGVYNPQGLIRRDKHIKRKNSTHLETSSNGGNMEKEYTSKFTNYPRDIITYSNGKKKAIHPCEKDIELMEYIIKTYSNENEVVLDFTMGSGSTGVACLNANRKFIGIEKDDNYFEIAKKRIEEHGNG
jgi:site-specific DNA-methyltransferase (adenine-specific)